MKRKVKSSGAGLRQQFKQLLGWTAEFQGNLDAGKPFLKDNDGILALYFDALSIQSEMSIDEPDRLVLGYTRAMMSFLLFNPDPARVAMIGLGGGSLAKYCYRHLPKTQITVVEINPDVIALRNEFAIPPDDGRFNVLLADGVEFVAGADGTCDVLMVDGFDTSGLPERLCSQQFYDDCFASLPDNGIMVVNLWGGHAQYHEHLARIRRSFSGNMLVIRADEDTNKIAFAFKDRQFEPSPAEILQHARSLGLSHPLDFHAKALKLIAALPIRPD